MTAVIFGREHWYAAIARRWNRAWGMDGDDSPVIYIRRAAGPGIWVVVEPAQGVDSAYFDEPADAIKHARTLNSLHGWPIAPTLRTRTH